MDLDFKEFNGLAFTAYLLAGKTGSDNPGITPEYFDGFLRWIKNPVNSDWVREEIGSWPIVVEPIEPEPDPDKPCNSDFNLVFEMVNQLNDECGFWFTTATLNIVYEGGSYTSAPSGEIFIKKSSGSVGKFRADITSIPCSAKILTATLRMTLEPDEGLAWGDKEGVVEIRDGNSQELIRNLEAAQMHKESWNKGRPTGPVDFTEYVKKLRKW